MIETISKSLVDYLRIPISDNTDSIIDYISILNFIDKIMTNADVKYNNVPDRTFSEYINKNASVEVLKYSHTIAIVEFTNEISEIASGMLELSLHIITNTDKICPKLSTTDEQDRESVLLSCSKFMENFDIKKCNEELCIVCSESVINKLFPHPSGNRYTTDFHKKYVCPHPLGERASISLKNPFNNRHMSVILRD